MRDTQVQVDDLSGGTNSKTVSRKLSEIIGLNSNATIKRIDDITEQ